MSLLVKPSDVAKRLGVTQRRVCFLLATSRMAGEKQANGRWLVYWPLQITSGKRGPDMNNYPTRLSSIDYSE